MISLEWNEDMCVGIDEIDADHKKILIIIAAIIDAIDINANVETLEKHFAELTACTVSHFKHEEIALFPVLMMKSKTAEQITRNLIYEHKIMMDMFKEFEDIEDYDLSIKLLSGLMKYLSLHAKKEEDFFSTIQLTKDEVTRINEIFDKFGLH